MSRAPRRTFGLALGLALLLPTTIPAAPSTHVLHAIPGSRLDTLAPGDGFAEDLVRSGGRGSPLAGIACSEDALTLVLPSCASWVARYEGPGNNHDYVYSLAVAPDGARIFVTGQSWGGGTFYDYATVAYDATTGSEMWVERLDGPGESWDYAHALAVSPDGTRVFVTGLSGGDYATVAYDAATGSELWVARYSAGETVDSARSLRVSQDGQRVYVTGTSRGDYATIAYDAATGSQLWVARYDGPLSNGDTATSLAVSPDGASVFVTGHSWNWTFWDFATVAYDAATGSQRWVARYDGPGAYEDFPRALGVSPDGARVYVSGQSYGRGTGFDAATVAYDATAGTEVWVARYDGPGSDWDDARALAVAPDGGRVYVTGSSSGDGTGNDYTTMAYDATTGAEAWVARYDTGPDPGLGIYPSDDRAASIAVSPDGARVYVTGEGDRSLPYLTGEDDYDYATVAYHAADGASAWVARYDGPPGEDDRALRLAVSPNGARVYVAGNSWGSFNDYATVAYEADPALLILP